MTTASDILAGMKKLCASALLGFVIMILASCTTARKDFDPTECNEASANARGFSEGKGGLDPDPNYSYRCREDLREPVRKGYLSGYDKGRVEYKEQVAKWEAQRLHGQMTFGNGAGAAPPPPVHHCKISLGGHGFEATGPSLDDARNAVVNQCAELLGRYACLPLPKCSSQASQNPRAIYCSISVFTRSYENFGPTEIEAKAALKQQCKAGEGGSDFFCKEEQMSCKPNR
jgi:hypothetical protein